MMNFNHLIMWNSLAYTFYAVKLFWCVRKIFEKSELAWKAIGSQQGCQTISSNTLTTHTDQILREKKSKIPIFRLLQFHLF